MDSLPFSGRPHKLPAHTFKDLSRPTLQPVERFAPGSRTSYSRFRFRQHLNRNFFLPTSASPVWLSVCASRPVYSSFSTCKEGWAKNLQAVAIRLKKTGPKLQRSRLVDVDVLSFDPRRPPRCSLCARCARESRQFDPRLGPPLVASILGKDELWCRFTLAVFGTTSIALCSRRSRASQ